MNLKEDYAYYTTNISNDSMAMSLETANFMYYLCNRFKFKKVMDRGSGFSSFVLRLYAKEQSFPVEVFSIDHDSEWLEKTRCFLELKNLNTDNLFLWYDFYDEHKDMRFDFIFEDANRKLRKETQNEMVSLIKKNGIILWDDANKKGNRQIIKNQVQKEKLLRYDVTARTKDSYNRFSALTTRRKLDWLRRV